METHSNLDEVHTPETICNVNSVEFSSINDQYGVPISDRASDKLPFSSDSSSSDDNFFADRPWIHNDTPFKDVFELLRQEESSEEDSDELPEIPGSPIAQSGGANSALVDVMICATNMSPGRSDVEAEEKFEEYEEYEVREVEPSRAAEIHASSSSEDEDSFEDNKRKARGRRDLEPQMERSALDRPKTAAKDLEKYRDVIPNDFFYQYESPSVLSNTDISACTTPSQQKKSDIRENSTRSTNTRHDKPRKQKHIPKGHPEQKELICLSNPYTAKTFENEAKEHLIVSTSLLVDSNWIPKLGDAKNKFDMNLMRDPSIKTHDAETIKSIHIDMTSQSKFGRYNDAIRSIEDASHRPQEIDHWILSVHKAQKSTKSFKVRYKRPMPPISQLLELWPEAFDECLANGSAFSALSEFQVTLKELAMIICVVLDIPLYDSSYVQSLHQLFSLYLDIKTFKRDAES